MTDERTFRPELEDDALSVWDVIAILVDARWLVAGVTIAVTLLGAAHAFLTVPMYRADALVQVEAPNQALPGLGELSEAMGAKPTAIAELEIIRSRALLAEVAGELGMDLVVRPRRTPLVGDLLARLGSEESMLTVRRLDVERVPAEFTLRVLPDDRFELMDGSGAVILTGHAGEATSADGVSIFVESIDAAPGDEFTVLKRSLPNAAMHIQRNLQVGEKGHGTGLLALVFQGPDPKSVAETLNMITSVYVRRNVEHRSEEAAQTLDFIVEQLPDLKSNLDAAEARLNQFRIARGSVDLSFETRTVLDRVSAIQTQLNELELERLELQQRYTEAHPAIGALDLRQSQLRSDLNQLNALIGTLPEAERESVALLRDVQVANELYLLLLNRAQELRVLKAGTTGNVRVIDPALMPIAPFKPQIIKSVLVSLLLGLLAGAGLAFLLRTLDRGVENPALIESQLGIPVYAVIPHSEGQDRLTPGLLESTRSIVGTRPLAEAAPSDIALEAIRTLRTALQFSMLGSGNPLITISGPTAEVGKSFVSVNLACVLADAGKRVLLVDADMRRGHLNRYFGVAREPGLSQIIGAGNVLVDSIRENVYPGVDLLPTGTIPPNPSELLLNPRFRDVLLEMTANYDAIIIDVPPVLAVTDAVIVGREAANNFLVLRFGQHTMREIREAIKRLEHGGIKVQGVIMNAVTERASAYGYRKYGYSYTYTYEKD